MRSWRRSWRSRLRKEDVLRSGGTKMTAGRRTNTKNKMIGGEIALLEGDESRKLYHTVFRNASPMLLEGNR